MLIILQELHSKGFHDINAVVSLPFYAFVLIKCKQSDFITKGKIAVQVGTAVELKLMVLSSKNTLKAF
jgi:hypothetical protein